jgi:HAD superfamily hydrolase (TIGR01450 family)
MGRDRTQVRCREIMRPVRAYLRGSARPLTEVYDVALLDLDGVVYIGSHAVGGAKDALAAARDAGMRLAFVTNNASRPPQVVAAHLTELGIPASADEVVTSAQAAAHYLADQLPRGARVLVVGTTGLDEALRERGLVPVSDADGHVDAVVQGYSPDLTWRQLAEGALAIGRGVRWVATNVDPTVPSPRGQLPGNGAMVAALRHATGAEPVVTGKPDPTMHRESVQRSHAQTPIVVGDRLDTDIEGATVVGCDSLLVLSGVTSAQQLLLAPPAQRPTFVAADLAGLLVPHLEPALADGSAACGGWQAEVAAAEGAGRLVLRPRPATGDPESAAGDLDALRALCAAWWASGRADRGAPAVPNVQADDLAGAESWRVLERLGLSSSGDGGVRRSSGA